jgi:serine/threonine protein kinase
VYRARDLKLSRDVALKILPNAFASDPDRVACFHREEQVLASLNHPNIGHIYELEESNGTCALILELVEARRWPIASRRGRFRSAKHCRLPVRSRRRSKPRMST